MWQLDLAGGVYLADGRECKLLTGIDDHSRFVVIATVLAVPSGRAVAEAFIAAMRVHGVPAEVLTDNGKQFTGRFTRPRPAEVLFERVCREHGITAKLTRPYSPTTTGKIERWHQTLRREFLDGAGPFADLPSAQAAISGWVQAYNHSRPHQSLDMAVPASLFRPGTGPDLASLVPAPRTAPEPVPAPSPVLHAGSSAGAVEFDAVIAPSGLLAVIPRVQRIRMGADRAGQRAHLWADEMSVHVQVDGKLIKTVPSNLTADDLEELRMRGASPAGPPPATPALPQVRVLPAGTVIEADRTVDVNGNADLAGCKIPAGRGLAGQRVTLRLDGHLIHIVHDGTLARTLPCPIPAEDRARIRGARIAASTLPAPAPGPVSVRRKVPDQGVIMVTRQRLRVGPSYAGKIVTVYVEDTHFRITCDGTEIALHPRKEQRPVTRWKAKIHTPKT